MRKHLAFILPMVSVSLSLLVTGCGNSSTVASNSIEIKTQLTNPVSSWTYAAVVGNTTDYPAACDPNTDSKCIVSVGNTSGVGVIPTLITGASGAATGVATFETDALPDNWYFAATDSTSDTTGECPEGGSSQTDLSAPTPTALVYCGIGPVGMSVSPTSCTNTEIIAVGGGITRSTDCPATITLTSVSGAKALPVKADLQYGNFDGSGDLIVQGAPSASTSTTITVTTPTSTGTTYLAIRNSSNKDVVGAAKFTINQVIINQGKCTNTCNN